MLWHRLNGVPVELQHLLLTYPTGLVGSHEEARKKLYRRIYEILWVCFCIFGNITLYNANYCHAVWISDEVRETKHSWSTYVYLPAIVSVVRARFPQGIKARVNPTGPMVKYTIACMLSNYYFYNHSGALIQAGVATLQQIHF